MPFQKPPVLHSVILVIPSGKTDLTPGAGLVSDRLFCPTMFQRNCSPSNPCLRLPVDRDPPCNSPHERLGPGHRPRLVFSSVRNRVPDGRPTSLNPIRRSRCPRYFLPNAAVEELFDSRQSTDRFLFNLVSLPVSVITRLLDSPGESHGKRKYCLRDLRSSLKAGR